MDVESKTPETPTPKPPPTSRLNRRAILTLMKMFQYVTFYLMAGTIYCWVTIIQ